MHQSLADPLSLARRQDADRPEAERLYLTDPSARAHDVAHSPSVANRDKRERREPSRVVPECAQHRVGCTGGATSATRKLLLTPPFQLR